MFARTSTWSGSPEELQKWADHASGKVRGFVQGLPGNAGAVFLIDREGGTALTLVATILRRDYLPRAMTGAPLSRSGAFAAG